MLPLVDITDSGIEVRRWVGRLLEVLVDENSILEGWVFQREVGERMGIQYLEEGFCEALRELQERGVGLIPEGVDVRMNMILRRSFRRGSTT